MPRFGMAWCGGGSSKRRQVAEPAVTSSETAIKRLDEIDNYYSVDYTKAGFLGKGHFAEVYRGTDIRSGRSVAIKKISRRNQDTKNLRTEIAALLKVNGHPNIVQLFDVFIDDSTVILSLELLEGGELFSRIVNFGAYSELEASGHFKNVAGALQFMHQHGIVHRDLKPENLVLATQHPDSEIKISDFGLSKVLGEDQSVMYTVCGTSAYAAPEVGFSDNYDAKVDTWSLGVILFVVLSAYHPFDPYGKLDDVHLRSKVVHMQWDFNDKIWSSISDDAKDLIRRLLCQRDERLDATQILAHPWISRQEFVPRQPIEGYSARNLRNFLSSTAFLDMDTDATMMDNGELDVLMDDMPMQQQHQGYQHHMQQQY